MTTYNRITKGGNFILKIAAFVISICAMACAAAALTVSLVTINRR